MGRKLALSLASIAVLAIFGLGLLVTADMLWRTAYTPTKDPLAGDTRIFEYRDYVVTTHPSNLVVGLRSHIMEKIYPDEDCRAADGAKVRFNSLGYRSPDFINLPPKGANEVRIILTGGSAAISLSINEACTLAVNLERMLKEKHPDKVFRVFTLGSSAWKSFQELIAVQMYGRDIKYDLVIAFDGFNDITHSFGSDYIIGPYANWHVANAYSRLREWVWGGPLATFQGVRLVHDVQFLSSSLPAASTYSTLPDAAVPGNMATRPELPVNRQSIAQRTDFDPRNRKVVDQFLHHMKLMDLAAESSGSPVLHVLQPVLYLKEPFSEEERKLLQDYQALVNYTVQGYLRTAAGLEELTKGSKNGHFLDLSTPFQGDASTYFRDYVHINAAGYRIVAAKIADAASEILSARQKDVATKPER